MDTKGQNLDCASNKSPENILSVNIYNVHALNVVRPPSLTTPNLLVSMMLSKFRAHPAEGFTIREKAWSR